MIYPVHYDGVPNNGESGLATSIADEVLYLQSEKQR